jgi:glycosyltransferase involved in cell wall biosynthesis
MGVEKMMIKIMHLITDLDTGGGEMMLLKLLQTINLSSFKNVVVSMMDLGTLGSQIESMGIPVYTLNMQRGIPNPLAFTKLLRIIRNEQPTLLQTWLYHADLMGVLAGTIKGIPVIWNVLCADIDLSKYSFMTSVVFSCCKRLSDKPVAVIVNSTAGLSFHQSLGYNPRSWQVIPNGFDINLFHPNGNARKEFRRELGLSQDSILIGIVARDDPMKDLPNFIYAGGILLKESITNDIHFIMVGRGINQNNQELNSLIENNGWGERFHLLGERGDIPMIMAALDTFCLSSLSEGFPTVIGEAMACGVPCVVTDAGDSAVIVGDTGKVVPVKNPEALATACLDLINMTAPERLELGKRARERIEQNFNLPVVVARYEDLYREIADNVRN